MSVRRTGLTSTLKTFHVKTCHSTSIQRKVAKEEANKAINREMESLGGDVVQMASTGTKT